MNLTKPEQFLCFAFFNYQLQKFTLQTLSYVNEKLRNNKLTKLPAVHYNCALYIICIKTKTCKTKFLWKNFLIFEWDLKCQEANI